MTSTKKNTDDSFINVLPNEWTYDRLKDIVVLRNEKTNDASEDENYLELEDIESGKGNILNWRNTLAVESAVTVFKTGDVLFGKLRPYLEKYYLADKDGKCTGEILAFKPERIFPRFLFYSIAAPWFIKKCNAIAYGAKMPRVNWSTQLAQFIIPLPPLPEQIRIAAYLDASCAAIDAAVNAKKKQIESLEHLREEIIENAVTKGIHISVDMQMIGDEWIGEIPANWTVVRLKRIISAVDYGISESTTQEGRFLVLKMGHIQGGEIKVSRSDYVDAVSSNLLLDSGDLLYNRTNSPDQVGKAAIFRGEMKDEITFASYLVRLKTNHRADSYYLNYVLNSRGFLSFARKLAIPSVQQSNLNATRYCRMLVPLPPIEEQRSIRKFLDAKISEVSALFSNIESQIATLIDYRKSLIHECVTGQRRISEADVAKVERTLEQAAGLPQQ